MHNIIFSIGDWSCDGHSCYAEYIVQSNKPLQELREIHFRENDFLGSLCSEYENNKVELLSFYNFLLRYNSLEKSQSIIKLLLAKDFTLSDEELEFHTLICKIKSIPLDYQPSLSFAKDDKNQQYIVVKNSDLMLTLWILCLSIIDPLLELKVVSEALSNSYINHKGYPLKTEGSLHFYGFDSQNRHLKTPGYGVWSSDETEFFNDVN